MTVLLLRQRVDEVGAWKRDRERQGGVTGNGWLAISLAPIRATLMVFLEGACLREKYRVVLNARIINYVARDASQRA
ncbi:uncharacterized protein ARMOST_14420 [Armillaria ostoyae]|uniref:Uncharacterized protein n=1 Tax=Armillaria ostoyae TaxID=47428 RepID=A0A284RQJ4_ARMOS|nr:uncharacterized protein ARMOST_14420 [Armillaria ostoyae]